MRGDSPPGSTSARAADLLRGRALASSDLTPVPAPDNEDDMYEATAKGAELGDFSGATVAHLSYEDENEDDDGEGDGNENATRMMRVPGNNED